MILIKLFICMRNETVQWQIIKRWSTNTRIVKITKLRKHSYTFKFKDNRGVEINPE